MNQHSPGNVSEDEDIEMIGMHDQVEPIRHTTREVEEDEEESEEEESDDANRALLGHTQNDSAGIDPKPRIWPQIRSIVIESAPTLLMTTVSLLFTGKLLDQVSHWPAMLQIDQLIMLIPTLLNLNGNLEMNLSARLSTAANTGELDHPPTRRAILIGSLALLQVQTISVSFIAACVSLLLGVVVPRTPSSSTSTSLAPPSSSTQTRHTNLPTLIFTTTSSTLSASLSSLILGSLICILITTCRTHSLDPDNIAPAIASCLGDLFTLLLLGATSALLIPYIHTPLPLLLGLLTLLIGLACLFYTLRNEKTRALVKEGWAPLFGAMAISSATGIVLDMFVSRYKGFAILAVVISGLPGAAGSILISRLSTSLHSAALTLRATLPSHTSTTPSPSPPPTPTHPSPLLSTLTLLLITTPIELLFLLTLTLLHWLLLPPLFTLLSLLLFCIAVLLSLLIATHLTLFLWARGKDPDFWALPVHSALMDLVGQVLLVCCFEIVQAVGGKVGVV